MTVDELIANLELDKETADLVRAKVKAEKVASIKAAKELEDLQRRSQELEAELVGDGKKGARNYKQWYDENFPKIQKLQSDYAKYVERYGAIDPNANPNPANPNPNPASPNAVSKEDFDKTMNGFTGQWSSLLKGSGKILERHIRSGRTNEIDWDKLSELAATKGGDLIAAYDEWDKPEREKSDRAAREKEINAEVEKRLKARQTDSFFPSTEQVSTGVSPLSKDRGDAPKYDRSKVIESAVTGLYEPATVH